MIRVSGQAKLNVDFEVEIDMTEEEFDNLSSREIEELIESHIDWHHELSQAELDDIYVDDLEELSGDSQ